MDSIAPPPTDAQADPRRDWRDLPLNPLALVAIGLVPQEWCPGGNRCQKATNGKTGRCHNRARWCDTQAAERYDRYGITWTREPGSYAYKVCNTHARMMLASASPPTSGEGKQ